MTQFSIKRTTQRKIETLQAVELDPLLKQLTNQLKSRQKLFLVQTHRNARQEFLTKLSTSSLDGEELHTRWYASMFLMLYILRMLNENSRINLIQSESREVFNGFSNFVQALSTHCCAVPRPSFFSDYKISEPPLKSFIRTLLTSHSFVNFSGCF